jgi:hypothetical protein
VLQNGVKLPKMLDLQVKEPQIYSMDEKSDALKKVLSHKFFSKRDAAELKAYLKSWLSGHS